jgi:hypothetical protein
MNTLVSRLNRSQVRISAAALAGLAVLLLITGIAMAGTYHGFLGTCASAHTCADGHSLLFRGDGVLNAVVYATMAVPLLFGLFWGAPLLAREFEAGTHSLAWTQGVTRRRWLAGTAGWALTAAVLWGAVMSALVSWWRLPENAVGIPYPRFDTGTFDIQGLVPVAYSVFAVALGIAAGALFRRLLPAMATTFAVFVGLRFGIAEYIRPHYMTPFTKVLPLAAMTPGATSAVPVGSWVVGALSAIGPNGHNYGDAIQFSFMPAACRSLGPGNWVPCLAARGFHSQVTYQPATRFWAFQGIEAGIFVVLAAALITLTWRLVLTRDA